MRTNEDHFSSLVLMRTKSSIEDLYGSTRYTAKIQVSVYNQKLQNLKMVPFVGEQSLSDIVHFMQFTGLACGLIVPSSIIRRSDTGFGIWDLARKLATKAKFGAFGQNRDFFGTILGP